MQIIGQRAITSSVRRTGDVLRAEAALLGQGIEAGARLVADIRDLVIREAGFEAGRNLPGAFCGRGVAETLPGIMASFERRDFLDALGRLSGPAGEPEIRTLFLECVKAFTQAETFVLRERGHRDEMAYEAYWWERERDGCLYYAQPQEESTPWFSHVGDAGRKDFLYTRVKNCFAAREGTRATAWGTLTDSYHEMDCRVDFDPSSGEILDVALHPFRMPDPVCHKVSHKGQELIGRNARELTRKDIAAATGGSGGCFHMADLATDLFALIRSIPERRTL